VREQAAFTLWSLAGSQKPQRKMIAEKIGISQILSMIMSKSERLQFVGLKCMQALVLENVTYQNLIIKENGIEQLIRLLRANVEKSTSARVTLAAVETVAALCFGIGYYYYYFFESLIIVGKIAIVFGFNAKIKIGNFILFLKF
jgi:hypothetical protein